MDAHRRGRWVALVVLVALVLGVPASALASFGASDASFSGDGWLTLSGGQTSNAQATAVALQSDRRIVAAGVAMVDGHQRFAVTAVCRTAVRIPRSAAGRAR